MSVFVSATALASGNDPGKLFFDQARMHQHLIQCIEAACILRVKLDDEKGNEERVYFP